MQLGGCADFYVLLFGVFFIYLFIIICSNMSMFARSFVRWWYHWWEELDLRSWLWDKVTILPLKNEEQNQGNAHHFFYIERAVHVFILAGQTVDSTYYCDVLWQFHENVQKLRPELWQQKNWLLHHNNNASSHTSFSPGNFLPKTTWLSSSSHPTHLTWSPATFSVSLIEGKTEMPLFWHNWGGWGRTAGGAEHPHRTWLPGSI
jgi:hypothetical protein